MAKAIKLVLKEGTTFDLYFLDGTVKRYDILRLAKKYPQLNALKDRNLFLKGKLPDWSGVEWNDELDIDSQSVYECGTDVTNEYNDIDIVVIGYKIKLRRLELFMSQEDLANKVGIDQSDLSKIEKGNANPSLKTLLRISEGLDSNFLVTFEKRKNKSK